MKTITTFILLMLCVSAQARLNETLEQCERRYGAATGKDAESGEASFSKAGIVIRAHFHAGKVDFISFTHEGGAAFTPGEISVLNEANLGVEWKTAEPLDVTTNEVALYSRVTGYCGYVRSGKLELVYFSIGYLERTQGSKAKEGDAGRKLEGF